MARRDESMDLGGTDLLEALVEEPLSGKGGVPPHPSDPDMPASGIYRTEVSFFTYLGRRIWVVIIFAMVLSGALATRLVTSTALHRSQAIIFVDGASVVHRIEGAAYVQEYSPGLLRVLHLATSSAMFDHLAEKFDLPAHFGITGMERTMDEVHRILDARITATIVDRNSVRVDVKDEDAVLSAAMGNEIFARTREWLEVDRRDRLLRSLEVYEVGAERAEERIAEKFQLLRNSLDSLPLLASGHGAGAGMAPVQVVQELAAAVSGYAPAVEREAFISVMLEQELGPSVLLAKRAVPDRQVEPIPRLVVWSLITAMVATMLAIGGIYCWWAKRDELVRDWRSLFHRHTGNRTA